MKNVKEIISEAIRENNRDRLHCMPDEHAESIINAIEDAGYVFALADPSKVTKNNHDPALDGHLETLRRQLIDQKSRVAEEAIDYFACGGRLSGVSEAVGAYMDIARATVKALEASGSASSKEG